jgi:hypothetical protein
MRAPVVADVPGLPEHPGRHADRRAPDGQEGGEEFLRQRKLVAVDPVMDLEPPARAPPVHGVEATARGALRRLGEDQLGVAVHEGRQPLAPAQGGAERRCGEAEGPTANLDQRLAGVVIPAEGERQADQPVVADVIGLRTPEGGGVVLPLLATQILWISARRGPGGPGVVNVPNALGRPPRALRLFTNAWLWGRSCSRSGCRSPSSTSPSSSGRSRPRG